MLCSLNSSAVIPSDQSIYIELLNMFKQTFDDPFAGSPVHFPSDTSQFKSMGENDRVEYQKMVNETQQRMEEPKTVRFMAFPKQGDFQWQNQKIHYHSIQQSPTPTAVGVFVHGLNSHGGTAGYFGDQLTKANPGMNFYAYDQLNFGQSGGETRGYLPDLDSSVEQAQAFVDHLKRLYGPQTKIFLVGSSYGATITTQMVLNQPQKYSGAVYVTPAFGHNQQDHYYLKLMVKYLGSLLPKTCIPLPLEAGVDRANRYDVRAILKNDKHRFSGGLVPGTIRNCMLGMDRVRPHFKDFKLPFITFMGGHDKIVDVFGPVDFEQESCSSDKTTVYFKDMWHNGFMEEEVETMSKMAAQWLQEHI